MKVNTVSFFLKKNVHFFFFQKMSIFQIFNFGPNFDFFSNFKINFSEFKIFSFLIFEIEFFYFGDEKIFNF